MPSPNKPTVALCMIVRNEEQNLGACLDPVCALFDEIVILDTGSKDRTKEIALKYTDKVHDFAWCDDFSAARNESIRLATSDWIFWLDADDRMMPAEVEKLRQVLKALGDRKQAYLMTTVCRKQYECDGVQLLSHTRLFRRHPELRWRGRVHEQLWPNPKELGYEILIHDARIEHLGYSIGSMELKKSQRDIRLLRMDYAMDPDDESTLYHLGLAYARIGNLAEGIKYLETLEGKLTPNCGLRCRVIELLAEFVLSAGDVQRAIAYLNRGLETFPDSAALLYARAQALYEIDDYDGCLADVIKIRQSRDHPDVAFGSMSDIRERWAPILHGDALRMNGNPQDSVRVLSEVLATRPDDIRVMYSLAMSHLEADQRHELPALRKQMERQPQGEVFSLLTLITESLKHRRTENLGEAFDRLIQIAPQMPHPRILRVEYLGMIGASVNEYLAACRDALRLCPNHAIIREHVAIIEKKLASQPQRKRQVVPHLV